MNKLSNWLIAIVVILLIVNFTKGESEPVPLGDFLVESSLVGKASEELGDDLTEVVHTSGKTITDVLLKAGHKMTDWDLFRASVYRMAEGLNKEFVFDCTNYQLYDWIMKTFYAESKYQFGQDKAINSITDARGLIQFMPFKRNKLNIPNDVNELSPIDQVGHIHNYFTQVIKLHKLDCSKINSFIDVYLMVFAPAYADNDDNFIVYKSCKSKKTKCGWYRSLHPELYPKPIKIYRCAYHANSAYDHLLSNGKKGKDGFIRKGEIADYIINKHFKHKK